MSHLSEHCFTSCLLRFFPSAVSALLVRQHIKLLPNEVDEINFCIDFHCLLLDCLLFASWRVGGSLIGIWGNKTIYRTKTFSIKRQSMKLICSVHDRLARAGEFGSRKHRSTSRPCFTAFLTRFPKVRTHETLLIPKAICRQTFQKLISFHEFAGKLRFP